VVVSNPLNLTIIPATKQWQNSTLKSALAVLDSSDQKSIALDGLDSKRRAAKQLRYLGTEDAARELARHMTGSDLDWDFSFGLIGSLAPDSALNEMKKLLTDPNFPVSGHFLGTMSVLAVATESGEDLPNLRAAAEAEFRNELASAIGNKKGEAQAVSAQ